MFSVVLGRTPSSPTHCRMGETGELVTMSDPHINGSTTSLCTACRTARANALLLSPRWTLMPGQWTLRVRSTDPLVASLACTQIVNVNEAAKGIPQHAVLQTLKPTTLHLTTPQRHKPTTLQPRQPHNQAPTAAACHSTRFQEPLVGVLKHAAACRSGLSFPGGFIQQSACLDT